MPEDGFISLGHQGNFYTLRFERQGWLVVHLVQYLGDILDAGDKPAAILKLLGYTLDISVRPPSRKAAYWVIADLDNRILQTNAVWLEKAVDHNYQDLETDPGDIPAMERTFGVLDSADFTFEFFR